MKKISWSKLLNSLIACSFIAVLLLPGCGERINAMREEAGEKVIDFKVREYLFSDQEDSPFCFAGIFEVCANSRYIYVSDWKKYTVKIFDLDFKLIKEIGRKGNGPGEFGQIFADHICNENRIYILTINRLYTFSETGEFLDEITLRFIPRSMFAYRDCFIFRMNAAPETFFVADTTGKIKRKFHKNPVMHSEKCKTATLAPYAYLSSSGKLFVMSLQKYEIKVMDPETEKIEKILTRDVDYKKVQCRKHIFHGANNYAFLGGYSRILEDRKNYYYLYYDSKNETKIDVYEKNSLSLLESWSYTGEFKPICIHPVNGDFIGVNKEETDALVLTKVEEVTK